MSIVKTQLGSEESAKRTRFAPASGIAATNVQDAILEAKSDTDTASEISFTPDGSIAATDVQAAIVEVRDEAAPVGAEYIVGAASASLTAERVVTNTTSITWDLGTAAQAQAKRAALIGDVTASADSNTTTIANEAVSNAKMADMAQSTIKGRAAGAGTGAPTDLSAAQTTAILDAFVGDSGAGGTKGLVPAPVTGDATKVLKGDGTWSSGGTGDMEAANNLSDVADAPTSRTNLGVGTGDSPQFTALNIGHASDTTVTRTGAGDIAVEGNALYRAGGTDVPVADGGTGASTAQGAAANLAVPYVVAKSAVAVSVGAVTTETVLATIAIPAGAIGPNGFVRFKCAFSNNNSGNNKTFKAYFGASGAGTGGTQLWTVVHTTNVSVIYVGGVANRNSASSQVSATNPVSATGLGSAASALATSTVDTTAASEIVLTGTKANSGDTLTLEFYEVDIVYGA